jgi:glycosyltransferase involved in cell wall biosynthesis
VIDADGDYSNLKMLALSFRFPHHGVYSSYHRLLAYLAPPHAAVDATLPAVCYSRYLNPRGVTHRTWLRLAEQRAWKIARRDGHEWLHYLYPEHGYFRGAELRSAPSQIAISCHLPRGVIERGIDRLDGLSRALAAASAVIVMSPDNIDYYARLAPAARTAFIPHGVDVNYFTPAKKPAVPQPRRRLLTVGNMLRDFDTLRSVIDCAAARQEPWVFTVIANRDRLGRLSHSLTSAGRRLLEPLCGISDQRLLHVYQTSDVLYLPLLEATANNAFIEAMSCGLPVVVTDLPATRAYGGDVVTYISSKDATDACDLLGEMLKSESALDASAAAVRKHAEDRLSWTAIVRQHERFLLEGRDAEA